ITGPLPARVILHSQLGSDSLQGCPHRTRWPDGHPANPIARRIFELLFKIDLRITWSPATKRLTTKPNVSLIVFGQSQAVTTSDAVVLPEALKRCPGHSAERP